MVMAIGKRWVAAKYGDDGQQSTLEVSMVVAYGEVLWRVEIDSQVMCNLSDWTEIERGFGMTSGMGINLWMRVTRSCMQ